MCKLFDDWSEDIRAYCIEHNLDFEKARRMPKSYSKTDIALQHVDKEKGKNGLRDETPAPVVLWIIKEPNGTLVFKQTEYTEKYLKKVS